MNAYKCDRCQELFDKTVEMRALSVRCEYRNMYIGAGIMCSTRLDLCPSCKESFSNWFCSAGLDKKEGDAE